MTPPIIGVSQSIERVRNLITHVADTDLNTVITGESGVGKEVVAQNLYNLSPRKGKPFVKINCASIPEGLLESELFGYERGAFTGATRRKKGKFELAHSGVLFLDEIGEMSFALQSKLLHVLQSGEFSPLGSEKEITTDTWVIAATNQDLEKSVEKGRFRKDLYYRLNIINIHISPLRSRPEDIPPIIMYYMKKYSTQFGRSPTLKPDTPVMDRLIRYHWPGNVREIQAVIMRYLLVGNWDEIFAEFTRAAATEGKKESAPEGKNGDTLLDWLHVDENMALGTDFFLRKIKKKSLERIEKEVIGYVLAQTGWNRSKASKILKISYKTLLYKISELNLLPPPGLGDVYENMN